MSNLVRSVNKSGVFGSAKVQDVLENLSDKQAANLMRSTVQAVATVIAKETRKLAPKKTGKLRKGIKAKRRKAPRFEPVSEVISSAHYWRFVDKGYRAKNGNIISGTNYTTRAMDAVRPRIGEIGEREFMKRYRKALTRGLRK